MGQFSNYPVASSKDYADATTLLIQNADGETKLADLATFKSAYLCNIQCASLSIATADVLTLNSIPVELVAAPGAGYAIEVINASLKMVYNSVAYATNTSVQLLVSGAAQYQSAFNGSVLSSASSTFNSIGKSALAGTNVIENAALNVTVGTGDPTAGDSDIEIFVLYRLIAV